jgi:hypothetical protein
MTGKGSARPPSAFPRFLFEPGKEQSEDSTVFSEEETDTGIRQESQAGHEIAPVAVDPVPELLEQIRDQMTRWNTLQGDFVHTLHTSMGRMLLAMLERCLPSLARTHGARSVLERLETFIQQEQGLLRGRSGQIRIRLHPDHLGIVQEHFSLLAGEGKRTPESVLVGDASLGPGECCMDWPGGGLEFRMASAIRALEQVLGQSLCAPEPESVAEKPMENVS